MKSAFDKIAAGLNEAIQYARESRRDMPRTGNPLCVETFGHGIVASEGHTMLVRVFAEFDADASVWVAQSDDVPLVTEADTVDALRAKLPNMVRDVLEANEIRADVVDIEFTAHSMDRVPVAA